MKNEDVKWVSGDEAVVFESCQGVAVYSNGYGQIIIRQQRTVNENENVCIFIPVGMAKAVASAITKLTEKPQ